MDRWFVTNCGIQKEEARWRGGVEWAEAAAAAGLRQWHALLLREVQERLALYNGQAAQRSNHFRMYLTEKKSLVWAPPTHLFPFFCSIQF